MEKRWDDMINELMELKPRDFFSFMNRTYKQYISSHKKEVDPKELISYKIRWYREENEMSSESLARRLGVTRMQIYRWEKGKCKPGNLAMEKMKSVGIL